MGSREVSRTTSPGLAHLLPALVALIPALAVALTVGANPVDASVAETAVTLLVLVVTTAAGLAAMRRSRGKEHRQWRLITIVGALLLAAHAFEAVLAGTGVPWWAAYVLAEIGYLSLVPAVLLQVESHEHSSLGRVRAILDVSALTILLLVAAYAFAFAPAFSASEGIIPVSQGFHVQWFVLCAALTIYLAAFQRRTWTPWQSMIAASLLLLGVGNAAVAVAGASPGVAFAPLGGPICLAGYGLLGAAAFDRARLGFAGLEKRPAVPTLYGAHWSGMAAPILSIAAMPFFIATGVAWLTAPPDALLPGTSAASVVLYGSAVLATALAARSAVALFENRRVLGLSVVDPLTGLPNQRYLEDRLRVEIDYARGDDATVSLACLDVHGFDRVNAGGRDAGDTVLRRIATALNTASRHGDVVVRLGGDEFAVVMPATDAAAARDACASYSAAAATVAHDDVPIEISVGIASFPTHASDPDELLRMAEGARYWARREGWTDRVVVYDPEIIRALGAVDYSELDSHIRMVEVLAAAVDARDPYTLNHSRNVSTVSAAFARYVGLDRRHADMVKSAALLHDVGKIGVPDAILRKPGRLSEDEFAVIRTHPEFGERILGASQRAELLPWIRHHHERWDGSGYPDGIARDRIPLEARILALADTYDAMTSERPYQPKRDPSEAIAELLRCSGSQFDPVLCQRFCEMLETTGREN
ncbi:MAG: diguanylate cyclase [Coriobacteriia bacterium]|nr:diguanylate cyclase [Coriobacteriia bacterium]